jgi:predicted nucleotidyltransferase
VPDRRGQPPQVSDERLQAGAAVCVQAGAELVYLFGSQVRGRLWAESDVDVAVVLGSSLPKERYGKIRVQLIGELAAVFESNDVDIIILNEAPPLLTYEGIIRGGRLLFEQDRLTRIRFEVRAFQEYVDTAPLREIQNRYLKEAIHTRAVTLPGGIDTHGHRW